MATPKGVHWALDINIAPFDSPCSTTDTSFASTSTLQFLNSQLVAHGFTSSPGLCLDGLADQETERVAKCLLGMLSQRVADMGRTEELTAKLRTLSYDHDRLVSMHRTATDRATYAEKEMTLHKSRLLTMARELQMTTNSLKQNMHELQRIRNSVQGLRQSYATELKRKEKEAERMVDKWTRLADVQSKLSGASSGLVMKCANVAEGLVGTEVGTGEGYLETALKDAERFRHELAEENAVLRALVLTAVNELGSAVSLTKNLTSSAPIDEEPKHTLVALFPLGPAEPFFAANVISSLATCLNESIERLSQQIIPSTSAPHYSHSTHGQGAKEPDLEVTRLQEIINTLRAELELVRRDNARETQALFDQYATAEGGEVDTRHADMSMELMMAPTRDVERERIEELHRELDTERAKFTNAAVKLGQERAQLEAEKLKLLEEKRQMQFELMLADLPPTPAQVSSSTGPLKGKTKTVLRKASPAKKSAGRKTRGPRRSSVGLVSPGRNMVEPSYETEVIPPPPPAKRLSFGGLLPTKFVLPPPSPLSSLPSQPVAVSLVEEVGSTSCPASVSPLDAPVSSSPSPQLELAKAPSQLFPIAKPQAPHMIHAYSPVKPSPLSRLLMLSDSPTADTPLSSGGLDAVPEATEKDASQPKSAAHGSGFLKMKVGSKVGPTNGRISRARKLPIEGGNVRWKA